MQSPLLTAYRVPWKWGGQHRRQDTKCQLPSNYQHQRCCYARHIFKTVFAFVSAAGLTFPQTFHE